MAASQQYSACRPGPSQARSSFPAGHLDATLTCGKRSMLYPLASSMPGWSSELTWLTGQPGLFAACSSSGLAATPGLPGTAQR